MLIFVQVCRTIDKNLVSLWSIGYDRTNESNGINEKEAWSIWRKRFWRSWHHQKLLFRSSSPEAGRLKNFKCCSNEDWITPSLQKTGRVKQRLFQMDWKASDAYSVESIEKGNLYEVYNHYIHYSVFVSAGTRTTVVPATVFLQTWNGFEIDPSLDINQIRQKIIGDLIKLQTTLFDVLTIFNISFIPL